MLCKKLCKCYAKSGFAPSYFLLQVRCSIIAVLPACRSRWDAAMGLRLGSPLHDPYGGLDAESRSQGAASGGVEPLPTPVKSIGKWGKAPCERIVLRTGRRWQQPSGGGPNAADEPTPPLAWRSTARRARSPRRKPWLAAAEFLKISLHEARDN